MNIKEQAKITSILKALSESKESDPHSYVKLINKAVESVVEQVKLTPDKQAGDIKNLRESSLDISKLQEDGSLSREMLASVQKTNELVQRFESLGYQRPVKDNWVSEMLNNHQRGYLQSDIFTEAVVGLVWMAAKIVEKAFIDNKARNVERKSDVVTEIKGELAKITKSAERQLAHSQVRMATSERNNIMSNVISKAQELYNDGQAQQADKLIINTHKKLISEANNQYMHYAPAPEHKKVLSAAMSRESERAKLAEKSMHDDIVDKKAQEKDKGMQVN